MNTRDDVWYMACNSPPFAYSWKHPQPIATAHASSAVLSALQRPADELCQVPESVQTWTDECCWLCMIEAASLMYLLQMSLASCLRCCCLKLELIAAPTMIEMHRSSVRIGEILSLSLLLRLSWFFCWLGSIDRVCLHSLRACVMSGAKFCERKWNIFYYITTRHATGILDLSDQLSSSLAQCHSWCVP